MATQNILLSKCVVCSRELSIRPATELDDPSLAVPFPCPNCGTVHHGVLVEDGSHAQAREEPTQPPATAELESSCTAESAPPVHRNLQCPIETVHSRHCDSQIEGGAILELQPKGPAFADSIRQHGSEPYAQTFVNRFLEECNHSDARLENLFSALHDEGPSDLVGIQSIFERNLAQASDDVDLFTCLGINVVAGGYPSRHSLHTSMLAMAIAARLGWDEQTLLELGIGCLLHDVGMLRVNQLAHGKLREVNSDEFLEITKHPLYTFELLQSHLERIPENACMVIYQMHERCDGSGYPRARKSEQIHQLAKIAAVADVFVALVSPRPHRPGLMPYYAMKEILQQVQAGLLDGQVVRALLESVSLFPVGSYVLLSDDRVGTVIRPNGVNYTRPIVEIRADRSSSVVVDLMQSDRLSIAKATAKSQ